MMHKFPLQKEALINTEIASVSSKQDTSQHYGSVNIFRDLNLTEGDVTVLYISA
jgi:hypothetical protein